MKLSYTRQLFPKLYLLASVHKISLSSKMTSNQNETSINNEESSSKRPRSDIPTIGTHSGTFHCDEALGCYMLKQLPEYKNAKILRSRDESTLRRDCDIILDVGSEFDHKRKWYDHHQKTFQETLSSLRPELGDEFQIRLSSAGLIYTYYGERVIENILKNKANISLTPANLKLVFIQVYRNFIKEIDAIDNGVPMYNETLGEPRYKISTHVSARIGKLNPSWEEELKDQQIDMQARFEKAMETVGAEFAQNVLEMGGSWIRAREFVRSALENAKEIYPTGEIIMLNSFCPWKSHLFDLEKEYKVEGVPKLIVFADTSKNWRVAGVPINPDSFIGRKFLPECWRGLRDEELSQVAGVTDLSFAHHTGFIGGAKTKEAAIAMAIRSLEWEDL